MASNANWQSWVWVRWKANALSNAWETWKSHSQVKSAWSTLGEWDCVLCVDASTPDEVESFVWKNLRTNQWVDATHTTFAKKWW